MSEKDKGGPAFPITLPSDEAYKGHAAHDGMTLRDYFAAQVLSNENNTGCPKTQAKWAYEVADAMLEARK